MDAEALAQKFWNEMEVKPDMLIVLCDVCKLRFHIPGDEVCQHIKEQFSVKKT